MDDRIDFSTLDPEIARVYRKVLREMGRGGMPCPKGKTRKQIKARRKRQQLKTTEEVRDYVFARERDLCRCCRSRRAESMHELLFRSLGGKRSRTNSVAVCGYLGTDLTRCHGLLQSNQIEWSGGPDGAEDWLEFRPRTCAAAEHLKIRLGDSLWSVPLRDADYQLHEDV